MKPQPMLMIPGPTPVPPAVLEALARHPIGHRSEAFKGIMKSVNPKLQWLFQTKRPVFTYAASGTGAMEAALVNTLNPGDELLVLACGVFSSRWGEIAKELGLKVHTQTVPMGEANQPEELEAFLKSPEAANLKAVCLIHSETSTGVLNPIEQLSKIIHANSNALILVDTVTSLGAAPFKFDAWGIDVAVSGSQKGFMLPPGLAFLAVSERAMAAHAQICAPGYYFNFSRYEKNLESGQTPWTPAITLITGLLEALNLMEAETLDGIFARHRLNQAMTRAGVAALGLAPFISEDGEASPSVTSILPPDSVSVDAIRAGLREQFGITVANGQKELTGKIFRIGHLGAIFPRDILTTLASLEVVLHSHGYQGAPLGTAVAAAQHVLLNAQRVPVAHG